MKHEGKIPRHLLAAVVGVALAVIAGLVFLKTDLGPGRKLVALSYDSLFLNRRPVQPEELIIVYMDEDSHKDLNQSFIKAWDRDLHARLLERLTADHAREVVFDIVFSDPGLDPVADEHFARAIRAHGNVVLAADYVASGSGQFAGMTLIPPCDLLAEAANEHWGIAQMKEDPDFMIRQHYFGPEDPAYFSLGWAAAAALGAACTTNGNSRAAERWINYYGPPVTLRWCSYWQALYTNGVPPGFFSNKVVYVGPKLLTVFAGQRKDEFRNPYTADFFGYHRSGQSIFMPGVEVQATMFLNLLRGDWLVRTSPAVESIMIWLAGALSGFGLLLCRPVKACAVALVGMVAIALVAQWLFSYHRIWFPWMVIVAVQIPLALLWSILFNSVQLYVENRLYQQTLQMYLSPKLVKKFANQKDLLKPGASKQVLTALFSDVANFTSISEGMDSDQLAKVMNTYFETAVSQSIHATDGTVVKYIGDAIFAFWNAPDAQPDHAFRACEAALRFAELPPQELNGQGLTTRIGIHTGIANVGNFGSVARVDYTALGEAINLASRMEGLNKHLGTKILVTAETHDGIAGRFLTRPLGQFRLKGFEKAVGVFELVGRLERVEGWKPLHEVFAEGLRRFQEGDFPAAEAAFRRALEVAPEDGAAAFYLKTIAEFSRHAPAGKWTATVELGEK